MKKRIIAMCLFATACAQAKTTQSDWASWMLETNKKNPQLQSLHYESAASAYRASGMSKPIFNPAVETEIEKEGDAFNYRIGLASDIDWWNQQDIRKKLGNKQQTLIQLNVQKTMSTLLAEAIKAQITYQLSEQNYILAKTQVEQDLSLLSLVKAEVAAGEGSLTDIAILNAILGENIVAENQALSAYWQAQSQADTLLGRQSSLPDIHPDFWQVAVALPDHATLQQLPQIQLGYQQWQHAQQEVELVVAAAKPSPSVSMNIGEQDGTATVALSLSVPLTFRNNYQDEANEARQLALAAEQQFRAEMQNLKNTITQLVQILAGLKQRYELWQDVSGNSFATESATLHKRFSNGDLSIADYQGLIQQLRGGMQASIAIEETYKLNYVDYLTSSGQLHSLLQRLSTQANQQ